MRARCQSWRFIGGDIPEDRHLPVGSDHAAWRPCRAHVDDGQIRCRDCTTSLLTCPNSKIRSALANEPAAETWVLEVLATDGDAVVVAIARGRLELRTRTAAPTSAAATAPMPVSGHNPWS